MCLKTFTAIALLSLILLVSEVTCNNTPKYDHFTYTQQWPQSVCNCPQSQLKSAYDDRLLPLYHESCKIPENVTTWTVHGLWPSLGTNKTYPAYCNSSWKFEENQIVKIEGKMRIYWPKLIFSSNSRISFWKHEWEKHGTCCTNLPKLNSEFNYFNVGLDFNRKFDLLSMLQEAQITPSRTKSYQLADIRKAVVTGINGFKPYIHCCKGEDGKQRVEEVMICLDAKKLTQLIDCPSHDEDCNEDVPLYYEPINPFHMNLHV